MRILGGSENARANRLMLNMIDATLCERRSIGIMPRALACY